MGILLGWLCLFCFLGLVAKGLARKAGMKRADMVLMKLHKLLSGGFLLLGGGHILAVIPVFRARAGGRRDFVCDRTGAGVPGRCCQRGDEFQ